jgi:hypothetical protein
MGTRSLTKVHECLPETNEEFPATPFVVLRLWSSRNCMTRVSGNKASIFVLSKRTQIYTCALHGQHSHDLPRRRHVFWEDTFEGASRNQSQAVFKLVGYNHHRSRSRLGCNPIHLFFFFWQLHCCNTLTALALCQDSANNGPRFERPFPWLFPRTSFARVQTRMLPRDSRQHLRR